IKSKALTAAAVLTLAGGLSTAGTVAASAATPQCGNNCLTPRSAAYPGFVETVLFGIPLRGVPTIVSPAAGWNPGEDLTVPTHGPVNVSYFLANGMVSAAVASYFGGPGYLALQLEYAPYGHPTGLCSGIATTAYQDEALSLQPCSTPDTTVWILDFKDSQIKGDYSIINASTTDFTHPFVMTILGNPAHQLVTPIILQHLTGNPGNVPVNQLWSTATGTL
ncbi:MAG TPA: hypothetical protein VGS19_08505, partial [Streptosporangiaceae bacterium]|nr:hypothetical protein [Streptosporangiaceae bacterium]